MAKWYQAISYLNRIEEFEIIKETDKFVTYVCENLWDNYKENRSAKKVSRDCRWFKTKKEAIDWLREKIRTKIEGAKNRLAYMNEKLNKFNEMYPEE